MLALLIQSGANLEEINYDGKTPLEVALTNNNIDAAIMLIEAGASMHRENDTISPFMTAITLGNPRLVQAMINKGALEYINRNRDPRSAIMCIMSNNLDIMSALLVNDMTTSYPLARVTPIIQNALVKNHNEDQFHRFRKFQQDVSPEVVDISIVRLALILGTDEMQDICSNPGGSLEELHTNKGHNKLR